MRWAGHVARIGELSYSCVIWVGKNYMGKIFWRNIHKNNIKMDVKVWTGFMWLRKFQWRALVNTVMTLRVS
jgi:hypothetical protein